MLPLIKSHFKITLLAHIGSICLHNIHCYKTWQIIAKQLRLSDSDDNVYFCFYNCWQKQQREKNITCFHTITIRTSSQCKCHFLEG